MIVDESTVYGLVAVIRWCGTRLKIVELDLVGGM